MPDLDETKLATEADRETRTDWDRLRNQTDEDIARAVAADPDAAPIPTDEELRRFLPTPARRRP